MGQWFFPIFDRADFWNFGSESCSSGPHGSQRAVFSFPFLIGSNFGSDSSRGPVVFFSFSPGEMPMWRGGFLAPRAAVGAKIRPDQKREKTTSLWLPWVPKLHLNQSQPQPQHSEAKIHLSTWAFHLVKK